MREVLASLQDEVITTNRFHFPSRCEAGSLIKSTAGGFIALKGCTTGLDIPRELAAVYECIEFCNFSLYTSKFSPAWFFIVKRLMASFYYSRLIIDHRNK